MLKNNLKITAYIFIILAALSFLANGFFIIYLKTVNYNYTPFIPKDVSLVFDSQAGQNQEKNSLSFLLEETKKNQFQNNERTVIQVDQNQEKMIDPVLALADEIYIKLFNQDKEGKKITGTFNNQLETEIPFTPKTSLNQNNNLNIHYLPDGQRLNFMVPAQKLLINGQPIGLDQLTISTISEIKPDSIIQIGNLIIDLATYKNDVSIAIEDLFRNEILIYEKQDANILSNQNHSFETGLWTNEAFDCSNYLAGEADLDMRLSDDASSGEQALELSAKNHYACTYQNFPAQINNSNIYRLIFDYKNIRGNAMQYYYNLVEPTGENQDRFEIIETDNHQWDSYKTIINPKEEIYTAFELYFYAPSDGSAEVANLYDNVRLENFSLVKEINLPQLTFPRNYELGREIQLKPGQNSFEFQISKINLLENFNYSFEDGLWQNQVIDCSNYLGGEPVLNMELSDDASLGTRSLKLESENHYACTYKSFPINIYNDRLYRLVFDFKNLAGDKIQYYYNLVNETGENQDKFEIINTSDDKWGSYETIIDPLIGNIKSFDFHLYAPSNGFQPVINLYDNIRLEEIAPKNIYSYYLYAQKTKQIKPAYAKITARQINAWQAQIDITGINQSFMLVYPNRFSANWILYPIAYQTKNVLISNFLSQAISEKYHYPADDGGNSWYVNLEKICRSDKICQKNQDNSYNISLIAENGLSRMILFFPALSAISLIIALSLLVYVKRYQ